MRNEAETRAELIDPAVKDAGGGKVDFRSRKRIEGKSLGLRVTEWRVPQWVIKSMVQP